MATYYDGLNNFHKLNEQNPLQSSAQLVYLHLLHLNNCLGNCGVIQISDRALGLRTSLNKNTVTEAKRQLKNRGLIDFKTDRNKTTTYSLSFFSEKVGHEVGHEVGHTVGHEVGQPAQFPIHTRAIRFEDKRLKNKEEDEEHAREAKKKGILSDSRSPEQARQFVINGEADLQELWEHEAGYALTGNVALEWEMLASQDLVVAHEALIKAVKGKKSERVIYNHFRVIFDSMKNQKPQPLKGGDTNARKQQTIDYGEEPDTSWIKPPKRDNE